MTREKENNNKQQTTNVKTKKKNQTKSCCSYTQLGQIEARKWYRCLQTDRERESVCEKVMPPSILISVHPKNPQPKREQKTNRAKCWMDWVDGDDSGSEVGWRSELVRLRLTCAGTRVAAEQRNPHRKKKDREDRIRSVQGRRRRWWFDRRAHGGRNPKENEEEVGKKETLRNRSNDVYYFVSLLFLFLFTTILLFHSRVHSKKKKGKKNFIFFIAHLVALSPTHQTAQQILCVVLIHIHKSLSPSSPRERERIKTPTFRASPAVAVALQ